VTERYDAQIAVEGWGDAAQARLAAANVLIVGAGARGCAAAGYMAAAGVGRIGVVDGDQVALAELHRQLLHFTPDVTANKAESVRAKLALINDEVHVDPFPANVDERNAEMILEGADCVVDCTNARDASLLINDGCAAAGRPVVFGGTDGWRGWLMAVVPGESACLRCADAPLDAEVSPALGPVAGAIGSLQALEALKALSGAAPSAAGVLLRLDGRGLGWVREPVARRPDCICARG
jgi:molybdopterin/thiamine biosynthesis adenylyltransferase